MEEKVELQKLAEMSRELDEMKTVKDTMFKSEVMHESVYNKLGLKLTDEFNKFCAEFPIEKIKNDSELITPCKSYLVDVDNFAIEMKNYKDFIDEVNKDKVEVQEAPTVNSVQEEKIEPISNLTTDNSKKLVMENNEGNAA